MLPVIPILAIPLAYSMWRTHCLRIAALALFLISVTISVQSLLQPYKALADQNGVSELPLLRPVQAIFPALQYIQQGGELDMSRMRGNTGSLTYDRKTNAQVVRADPLVDEPGAIALGPHLAFQTGPYTATVTLRSEEADPSAMVAHIDVATDEGGRVLADRDVYAYEFSARSEPQAFPLPFSTWDTWPIEVRVYYTGQSELWLQSVEIVPQTELRTGSYPGLPITVGWGLLVIIAGLLAARERGPNHVELTADE